MFSGFRHWLSVVTGFCCAVVFSAPGAAVAAGFTVKQFNLPIYKTSTSQGNTHEIVPGAGVSASGYMWVTQPNNNQLVRLDANGTKKMFAMPAGAAPHGIEFDSTGRMWVTFEQTNQIAQINPSNGQVIRQFPLGGAASDPSRPCPANVGPHGLDVSDDAKTLWFAGKEGNVVGSVDIATGKTRCYATGGPKPIYVRLDSSGNAWYTILQGDSGDGSEMFTAPLSFPSIGVITTNGKKIEYVLPQGLVNSSGAGLDQRPITIVRDPIVSNKMWFSLEQGGRIASIQLTKTNTLSVSYFDILEMLAAGNVDTGCDEPLAAPSLNEPGGYGYTNPNRIQLAGIGFDAGGRLWVTMNCGDPPQGLGSSGLYGSWVGVATGFNSSPSMQAVQVSKTNSVLHRIHTGLGLGMWFTEEGADRAGRINFQ